MYWYEEEVKSLVLKKETLTASPKTIFYGSSTIRLWESLTADFAPISPVNLGFGGSTLAACVWFFDRIVGPYAPERMVLYAGDNDLGDGRTPEEVFIFFLQLIEKVNERFGPIPCYFISLKPSPKRWNLNQSFEYTNKLISEEIARRDSNWKFINIFPHMIGPDGLPIQSYYDKDGLHLSLNGYKVWKDILLKELL
ncbi:GDSL-type esterase/lipase family protein [Pedobacter sp. AW31-3R]|uniref:GDSL-type esterase/lipase family protein n=1 Tax=Pedobacter sp. AW31-3R TaxID=3445781 RepID=UPI003FA0FB0B